MHDSPDDILLEARGITHCYGKVASLCGVEIDLRKGEMVALLGPNGSGKSTLIQALFGHIRAEGEIKWCKKNLKEWTPRDLGRTVAYLPQTPGYQAGQSVEQVLNLGRAPYWGGFGLESAKDTQVVHRVAEQLALKDVLRRPMGSLSGGQRQRVFVGRCLVQEPLALLLDEPNTYLDLKHQVELCQLLARISQTQSIGILMASHDLNLAIRFADRFIVMSQGEVVIDGGIHVLEPSVLTRIYGVGLTKLDRPGLRPVIIPA